MNPSHQLLSRLVAVLSRLARTLSPATQDSDGGTRIIEIPG